MVINKKKLEGRNIEKWEMKGEIEIIIKNIKERESEKIRKRIEDRNKIKRSMKIDLSNERI